MATTVGIVGKSGSGKSTAIKFLDPKKTLLINCDGKSLPFKGWKSAFNTENKNYWRESDLTKITAGITAYANNKAYDCIVIDTVNAIMLDDEMAKSKQKGFDKWMDLAAGIYELIQVCNKQRDDLIIFLMFHSAEYRDDNTGLLERRILTNGRKLEKIQLETKLPIVLYTRVDGKGDDAKFYFETKTNDSTGKSPDGMFETFLIDNNLQIVIDAIKAYE